MSVQSDWNKFGVVFPSSFETDCWRRWRSQMEQRQIQVCLEVYTESTQIPTRDQTLNKPWTETKTFSRNFLCPQSKYLFSLSGLRGTTEHHKKVNFFTTPQQEEKEGKKFKTFNNHAQSNNQKFSFFSSRFHSSASEKVLGFCVEAERWKEWS